MQAKPHRKVSPYCNTKHFQGTIDADTKGVSQILCEFALISSGFSLVSFLASLVGQQFGMHPILTFCPDQFGGADPGPMPPFDGSNQV